MGKRPNQKRALILEKAKLVFLRKGFASVTMKDIIEECGISRGGIYLYFHSVDEIFIAVIHAHNGQKLLETQETAREDKPFRQIIDEYFEKQKNRLLHMQGSLLMAMHEYRFSHKSEEDREFYRRQFQNTKAILLALLRVGADRGEIAEEGLERLAVNLMYFIEGISTMAVSAGVSEDVIDAQFAFMKEIIFRHQDAAASSQGGGPDGQTGGLHG